MKLKHIFRYVIGPLHKMSIVLNSSTIRNRRAVLGAYLRVTIRHFVCAVLRLHIHSERILGLNVTFLDHRWFKYLFDEVFISDVYDFHADNHDPFIIDCGSNIGMTVTFFKTLYPRSRIVAFEPDPRTFAMLRTTVERNKMRDVVLVNKAVYDREGRLSFYYDPDHPGYPGQSTLRERLPKAWRSETVECVLLSDYVKGEVDFLKMDVEGAEYVVLRELSQVGRLRKIKEMVIEYHHHITPGDDQLSKFLGLLEENGFGYQIGVPIFDSPEAFRRGQNQDIMIHAYRK